MAWPSPNQKPSRTPAAIVARMLGLVASLVLLVALAWAGWFYASDQAVKATVVDKECIATGGSWAQVKTERFGLDHVVKEIGFDQCMVLDEGDRVSYHVRSKHTVLYDAEGTCRWDSKKGACNGA